jgi:hypothetical protein
MKQLALTMMLIGGALLSSYSSQAQGRGHHDNRGGDRRGYHHEREYRRDYRHGHGYGYGYGRGPREVYYGGGYACRPVETVVYAAPCPPPPPPRRVYYPRGPRVVIATGPIVVGF